MSAPRLFYLIGASGAGKDSLLDYAREQLPAGMPLVFAHRYITRPANAGGENHIALSDEEFDQRLAQGCFAMHWASHGLRYGIGVEADRWLALGLDVIVNGSREYLSSAAARYDCLHPILVTASAARLEQRLRQRGRESARAIQQRVTRAMRLDAELEHPRLIRLGNDGSLAAAGDALMAILLGHRDMAREMTA